MKKFLISMVPFIRLTFYVVFFLFFIITPTEVIEAKSLCFTYNTFHIVCPGCGITRSFSNLMHLNIVEAFNYNWVFIVAFAPLSLFIFFQDIFIIIKRTMTRKKEYSLIEYFFVGFLK